MTAVSTPLFTMRHARAAEYPVLHVRDAFRHEGLHSAIAGRRVLLVVSPTADRLLDPELTALVESGRGAVHRVRCATGEHAKVMGAVESVCRAAFTARLDRRAVMIAVGGGVCSDLVTMAASLFRRGIGHVRIPTTLIGQIDAGLGAKGAVNFSDRKNAIGCFHPPELVLIDQRLMRTLPKREIRSGIAEILKMALISDRGLFELVEDSLPALVASRFQQPAGTAGVIVDVAARRMLEALEGNLFERSSFRRIVDAGHTFSPSVEAASRFRIRHGEAVAIDLALSSAIAARLGLLGAAERDKIVDVIRVAGLPSTSRHLTIDLCRESLEAAVAHRGGRLNLPLFEAIGRPCFVDDADAVRAVLANALSDLGSISRDRVLARFA